MVKNTELQLKIKTCMHQLTKILIFLKDKIRKSKTKKEKMMRRFNKKYGSSCTQAS